MHFIISKCKLYSFCCCIVIALFISFILNNTIPNYKEFSQTTFFLNIIHLLIVNYLSVLNEMHSHFYNEIFVLNEYDQKLFLLFCLLLWLVKSILASFLIFFIIIIIVFILYLFYFTFISLFDELIKFYCAMLEKFDPHPFESDFKNSNYFTILLKESSSLLKQWEFFAVTNFKSSLVACIIQSFYFVFLFSNFVKVLFVVSYMLILLSLFLAYFYFFFKNLSLYYGKKNVRIDTNIKPIFKKIRISSHFINLKFILYNITNSGTSRLKFIYYILVLVHYILSMLVFIFIFILFCFILLYLLVKCFNYKFLYSYSPVILNVWLFFYCLIFILLVLYLRDALAIDLKFTVYNNFKIIFSIAVTLALLFFLFYYFS